MSRALRTGGRRCKPCQATRIPSRTLASDAAPDMIRRRRPSERIVRPSPDPRSAPRLCTSKMPGKVERPVRAARAAGLRFRALRPARQRRRARLPRAHARCSSPDRFTLCLKVSPGRHSIIVLSESNCQRRNRPSPTTSGNIVPALMFNESVRN
jgi:hypothetical protein